MMKNLIDDDQTSLNVSNDASTSDQSKYEQEIGSNTMSRDGDVLTNNAAFSFTLPFRIDTTMARVVTAEALGTFILMFCICGIIASTEIMEGQVGLLEYAVTATSTVIVVVFSIGTISGAHVNPAVTIAFATAGPFPCSKLVLWWQRNVGKLVYGIKPELMTTKPVHGCASAFFLELIATFIILFVACSLINESQSV